MRFPGILRGIFELGFYTDVLEQPPSGGIGPPLTSNDSLSTFGSVIGFLKARRIKTWKDWAWEIGCWLLLAAGIFLRQAMILDGGLTFDLRQFTIARLLASLVLALALFGPFMRWLNKKTTRRGLLKIALPFGFGFFAASTTRGLAYASKFFFS